MVRRTFSGKRIVTRLLSVKRRWQRHPKRRTALFLNDTFKRTSNKSSFEKQNDRWFTYGKKSRANQSRDRTLWFLPFRNTVISSRDLRRRATFLIPVSRLMIASWKSLISSTAKFSLVYCFLVTDHLLGDEQSDKPGCTRIFGFYIPSGGIRRCIGNRNLRIRLTSNFRQSSTIFVADPSSFVLMLCDRMLSRTRDWPTCHSRHFLTPLVATKDIVPFKYTSKIYCFSISHQEKRRKFS